MAPHARTPSAPSRDSVARADLGPLARHRQRETHGQGDGEKRRTAIGDERQGHALGRQQRHRHAHIDEGLHGRHHRQSRARQLAEGIARIGGAQQQPHGEKAEQGGDDGAKHQAEFLARHRENVIGMGVGNAVFDGARAGADAGKTAMGESLERQSRLIADVGRSSDIAPRGDGHAGKSHRPQSPAAPSTPASSPTQNSGRPAKNSIAPHSDSNRPVWPTSGCSSRMTIAGTIRSKVISRLGQRQRCAVGQHRGGQDGEAGLEEFRRLQADEAEIQFAPRAQHIGCPRTAPGRSRSAPGQRRRPPRS